MSDFVELEFKYFADSVSLTEFNSLMQSLVPLIHKHVSSFDTYYTKEDNKEEFQRFRDSDTPELTKKRKVKTSNNWERIESDLPLDPKRITEEKVSFHVGLDGYKKNFKIFKTCSIFWFDNINTVYYIVYDEELKEKGRFIEIELNKEKVKTLGVEGSFSKIKDFESILSKLGISPQNRLKKSLFEIFVK